MTTLVALTIMLVPAAATRTAGASSPVERNWQASYGYMKQIARKQRLRADDLQRRLTVRVLEARELNRHIAKLRKALKADIAAEGTSSLERSFLCIHRFEGSWTDPNAPYWGGLQMDMSFQRAYGLEYLRAWGTADHWPVSVQMAVAMKAYLTRGFNPWPNTARYCGLL